MVNNINQMGGIERVVCGLSSHFCAVQNHSVEIISINSFEDHLFFSIDPSVQIRHCGVDWRECTFRTLCHTVRGVMEELDADILLTCHPTISYAVLLNKRKFAGKVIVTQHSANDSMAYFSVFFLSVIHFNITPAGTHSTVSIFLGDCRIKCLSPAIKLLET